MKVIKFSSNVDKKLQEIHRKDIKLSNTIKKQIKLFVQNPRRKSLRLHRIKKDARNVWSISINKSIRMLYSEDEVIYFFDIGTHDEVYGK